MIPDAVMVREGGGMENLYASLAVSVAKLKEALRKAERERDFLAGDIKRFSEEFGSVVVTRNLLRQELAELKREATEVIAPLLFDFKGREHWPDYEKLYIKVGDARTAQNFLSRCQPSSEAPSPHANNATTEETK
jgi:hypothetical protein